MSDRLKTTVLWFKPIISLRGGLIHTHSKEMTNHGMMVRSGAVGLEYEPTFRALDLNE
jgi:hypothetical protein